MAGALSLTRLHSKDEILGWYLNSVFYGSASYGAEAASQRYFGKPARDLTLAEASFLAGIPNAPGLYDASENFDAVKGRQWKVLELMAKQEYINLEEAEAAWDVPLALHSQTYRMRAPHFVAYVRELLPRLVGETPATGGIKVATTLDPRLQAQAEDIVDRHVSSLPRSVGQPDAALVALDPRSGEVLAMVGGRWYDTNDPAGQVNNALALNQPGSAMKPITYLAAFEHGWAPATIVPDEPLQLNDGVRNYTLRNFDGKYSRRVSAREALGNSLNVPAVHALFHVGLHTVHDLAGRMGLTTLRPVSFYGPAFTLGGADVRLLDLVYAYGVLANGGEQKGMPSIEEPPVVRRPLDPSPILRVEDSSGNVVWKYEPQGEQVASEQHAYLVTHVLSDDNARTRTFGRNSLLNLPGRPAAAKTGLSEKPHDAWTIGYTPQLVAGVWVGHKNNAPMPGASSTAVASPIWHRFMVAALANQPVVPFRRPEGIQEMEVCRGTGAPPARGRCADLVRELFMAGQVPQVPIEVFVAEARRQLAAMDRGWARANDRQVIEKVRSDPTLFVDDPIGRAIRGQ